jgi:hypothetical protein|tara:strand:- start:260 stop:712 length:453 start_codon:yes stop_codon:yes gene_type:complete
MFDVNDSLTTIGFLVNEEDNIDFEIFFDISSTLGVHQKDIKIFSFIDIKTKTPTLIQNRIYSNHFNWRGEINNKNALDFLNTKLDVLVSYYSTKNNYLNLMTSKSKAKFKVGFNGVDDRLFDLIINIDPQKNLDVKSELLKYFKVLNKIK